MTRVLHILALACLLFSLCACSGKQPILPLASLPRLTADQATQIEIVHTPPGFEQGLTLVGAARQPAAGWNIRKTFGMLKYFTDF